MTAIEAGREQVLRAALRSFLADALIVCGDRRAVDLLAAARAEAEARGEVWWLAEIVRLDAVADVRFCGGMRAAALFDIHPVTVAHVDHALIERVDRRVQEFDCALLT